MRRFVFALLVPLLVGCWESKDSLFAGEVPVTPFKAGHIAMTSSDGERALYSLELKGGTYHLYDIDERHRIQDMPYELHFYPLASAPGFLVVEARSLCSSASCPNEPYFYAVAHPLPDGRVEEFAQNCTDDIAKKIGATNKGFVCEFADRIILENALRTLIGGKSTAIATPVD